MIGIEKGLEGRLKADFPYIVAVKYLSHIYHLICKSTLLLFPKQLTLVEDISKHFKRSNQHRVSLKKYQEEMGIDSNLTILSFSPNRWLSFTESFVRILKLWEPLIVDQYYFLEKEQIDAPNASFI